MGKIRDVVQATIKRCRLTKIYLEGPALFAKFQQGLDEVRGVVKLLGHDMGVPVVVLTPSNIKLTAVGKGNAPKKDVVRAVQTRYGLTRRPNNNLADAVAVYWCATSLDGDPRGV